MSKLMATIVVGALVGCSSAALQPAQSPPLAPFVGFAQPQRYTQAVTINRDGQDYRMLCVLELDEHGLVLVAFTELGQRLFTLEYRSRHPTVDRSAMLPATFDANLVLADLQLVYWPLSLLQESSKNGWLVVEPIAGNERRLLHDKDVVAIVHRNANGSIDILRPALRYHMTIEATSK
jgi:hypothetical protein